MIASADPIASLQAELREMTVEELQQQFQDGLRLSVEHLTRLAYVLAELEHRGQQILGIDDGLLTLLRRIAAGRLLAATVVRFAHRPGTMRRVGRLPIEEQRRIVDDEAECERLSQPQTQRKKPYIRAQSKEKRVDNPIVAAKMATTKDLAELILDMIAANPHPAEVWAELKRRFC